MASWLKRKIEWFPLKKDEGTQLFRKCINIIIQTSTSFAKLEDKWRNRNLNFSSGTQPRSILHIGQNSSSSSEILLYMHFLQTGEVQTKNLSELFFTLYTELEYWGKKRGLGEHSGRKKNFQQNCFAISIRKSRKWSKLNFFLGGKLGAKPMNKIKRNHLSSLIIRLMPSGGSWNTCTPKLTKFLIRQRK